MKAFLYILVSYTGILSSPTRLVFQSEFEDSTVQKVKKYNKGQKNAYFPNEVPNGHQFHSLSGQSEYVIIYSDHYADFPCKVSNRSGRIWTAKNVTTDAKRDIYSYENGQVKYI